MKREDRQHGLVQTSLWSPTSNSRSVNKLNSPPTAGLFTKVSPMPWNHSKFTGKCGRLMTWRVTDTRPRLTFSGFSGTSCILNHLANDHMDDDDDES
ncbi:hypothetical protein EJD97_015083 [Solanum chilense]|uniref:Uncharacterized protein n=1 Tax=Solanum chilense TaxID=4083 RepID=A0A6N2B7Q3_SOLCI|nr:hypothetical protein EJD97_015083 [Solanum chilense]